MDIKSIFSITIYKTGEQFEEIVNGCGQSVVSTVMSKYPRHSKVVLDGFEINNNFVPLRIKSSFYGQY